MATQRKQTTNTRCSVCRHPDRHAIEMAHVAGCSLEAIAVKYSKPEHALHRASVHRHCRDHLDEAARASYLADVPIQELTAHAAKVRCVRLSGVRAGLVKLGRALSGFSA